MIGQTVTFLIVEDDDIDVKVLRRAFKELKIANPVRIARDGIEGLEILRGENGQEPLERPYLILLDLSMPRMNGIEFLEAIRIDEALKASIVFVLTTSSSDEDKMRAYNHNIAGYIYKTKAKETFMKAIEMLDHFWRVIEFPGE